VDRERRVEEEVDVEENGKKMLISPTSKAAGDQELGCSEPGCRLNRRQISQSTILQNPEAQQAPLKWSISRANNAATAATFPYDPSECGVGFDLTGSYG